MKPKPYIYSPCFAGSNSEQRIMHDPPPIPRADVSWYFRLDKTRNTKPKAQLLTAAEERVLFLQYNYCRWRASRDGGEWVARSEALKARIIEYNLPLVISVVCRFVNVGSAEYDDLVCEGNVSLLRSVELFDISKGFKFSTYACHAICNMIFRRLRKKARELPTIPEPDLGSIPTMDTDLLELQQVLFDANLNAKERAIIQMRFLDEEPLILEEVGRRLSPPVSKERVRQIEKKALDKLKIEWYSVRTTDTWSKD